MKLSKRTLQIIKHFGSIDRKLLFRAGRVQQTAKLDRSLLVSATIDETIPFDFVVDSKQFIKVLQAAQGYLRFTQECLLVGTGNNALKYHFKRPDSPGAVSMPDYEFQYEFDLSKFNVEMLANMNKVLGLPALAFIGDGQRIEMALLQPENPDGTDSYHNVVAVGDAKFNIVIDYEKWKVMPDNYVVRLSKQGVVSVVSDDLTYYIAYKPTVWES
jgi:hypothetical protein